MLGILAGGYYLHNISLPIYKDSKNPKNNVRDMFLGFLMVCMSYIICGTLGVYGFANTDMFPDMKIMQNCLDMLPIKDPMGIVIRACTFF